MSLWLALGIWLLVSIVLTPAIGIFLSLMRKKLNQSNSHTDLGALTHTPVHDAVVDEGAHQNHKELSLEPAEHSTGNGADTGEASDLDDVDVQKCKAAEPDRN